jgi:hypothetical protein
MGNGLADQKNISRERKSFFDWPFSILAFASLRHLLIG